MAWNVPRVLRVLFDIRKSNHRSKSQATVKVALAVGSIGKQDALCL